MRWPYFLRAHYWGAELSRDITKGVTPQQLPTFYNPMGTVLCFLWTALAKYTIRDAGEREAAVCADIEN